MDIGIVGGSGYGGAELLRLLAAHPSAKVRVVAARRAAGERVATVFPSLIGSEHADKVLVAPDDDALTACDVVFLATPHAASLERAPALLAAGVSVVDLSGAFRLDAEGFTNWYGDEHSAPDLTPAAYGLPEFNSTAIAAANLVANPGCYPTAALLALVPIADLVNPSTIVVSGISGSSGAGKSLRDDLHVSHAHGNVVAYGAPRHRHTPEIEYYLGALSNHNATPVSFTPHLAPMARGMVVTAVAELAEGTDAAAPADALSAVYDDQPFVHVRADGTWPSATYVIGSNSAHIGVAIDERTRRVTVSVAIDNLVKGAAGQAIQNANVMTGLDQSVGLPAEAVYP